MSKKPTALTKLHGQQYAEHRKRIKHLQKVARKFGSIPYTFNPRFRVSKGDYGSKIEQLKDSAGKALNRFLRGSPDIRRGMIDNWEIIRLQDQLFLVMDEDGVFFILDGQHRLFIFQEYMPGKQHEWFKAQIYQMSDIKKAGIDLKDAVLVCSKQKGWTSSDLMSQEDSVWREALEDNGIRYDFEHTRRKGLMFSAVDMMRAYGNAMETFRYTQAWPVGSPGEAAVLWHWLNTDAAVAYEIAEIFKFWQDQVLRYCEDEDIQHAMFGHFMLTFVLLLVWENSVRRGHVVRTLGKRLKTKGLWSRFYHDMRDRGISKGMASLLLKDRGAAWIWLINKGRPTERRLSVLNHVA
jgi:hypothetical protein